MSTLQEALAPLRMSTQHTQKVAERVYLAVDVNNLWHSCRETFGSAARVNFKALLTKINGAGYIKVPRNVQAVAYTITAPHRRTSATGRVREEGSRNERFLASMRRFGYEVKTRQMRYEKGIDKPFHTDWDVGIAIDVLGLAEQFDTIIIASGDGDYGPLLKQIKDSGKRVEVYTFQNTASQILYDSADAVYFLGDEDIFQEKLPSSG